jgi:hypothetical protein
VADRGRQHISFSDREKEALASYQCFQLEMKSAWFLLVSGAKFMANAEIFVHTHTNVITSASHHDSWFYTNVTTQDDDAEGYTTIN